MKRFYWLIPLFIALLIAMFILPLIAQDTGVRAEALGQANLRSIPSIDGDIVGEISTGIQYVVLGRSEFFPWLLLGDPTTFEAMGWVFEDLVTVYGNAATVPFSSLEVGAVIPTNTLAPVAPSPQPGLPSATLAPGENTPTLNPMVTPGGGAAGGDAQAQNFTPLPSATPAYSVVGLVNGEINIRYGPGVDYPVVGRLQAGDRLQITAYHTTFPWVQVRFEESPTGFAWVANEIIEIQGDIYSLPAIGTTDFNLPTLTPTPSVLQASSINGDVVPISPEFAALGNRIWNQVLEADFIPESTKFGAIYLKDLQTGEAITFGNDIAFSGTSILKVAILMEYFGVINTTPPLAEAVDIANTMICSENVATNRLLGVIGGGDQLLGAERVTAFLRALGIERTFLTAPYYIPSAAEPTPPPRPFEFPDTSADQVKASPNPTNQLTVEDMGWLLDSMYQCAYHESGPLIEDFDNRYTPQECRIMLEVMSNNTVDGLLKAGVPASTRVAHKHGWVEDTHGNAAIFFTPGGDYVLVMMLHRPDWLDFTTESLPLLAEVSRTVYNYYNPDQPMEAIRENYIPGPDECNYNAADPLVNQLISPSFLEVLDPTEFYNPAGEATGG